jgi:hypothetical protein
MSRVPPPDIDSTKGTMYKRPGDADWEMATDPDGRDIARNIKSPPGESGFPNPVLPTVGS